MSELLDQDQMARRLRITVRRVQDLARERVLLRKDDLFDAAESERRYSWYRNRDFGAVADELERLAEEVDRAMQPLYDEPDLAKRRRLAHTQRVPVGPLDSCFKLSVAMAAPSERPFLGMVTDMIIGRTIQEWLHLMKWELCDEPEHEEPPLQPSQSTASGIADPAR